MTNQTGTSPAVGATEITHALILKALQEARATIERLVEGYVSDRRVQSYTSGQLVELDALIQALTFTNPDADGLFWWVVGVGVANGIVADGFSGSEAWFQRALDRALPYARGPEIKLKVIGSPDEAAINKAQSEEPK